MCDGADLAAYIGSLLAGFGLILAGLGTYEKKIPAYDRIDVATCASPEDAVIKIKSEISYRISTLRNLWLASEGLYIGAGGAFIVSAGATHCQLTSAWPWT